MRCDDEDLINYSRELIELRESQVFHLLLPEWRDEMRGRRPFSFDDEPTMLILLRCWTVDALMDGVCGDGGQSSADGKMAFNWWLNWKLVSFNCCRHPVFNNQNHLDQILLRMWTEKKTNHKKQSNRPRRMGDIFSFDWKKNKMWWSPFELWATRPLDRNDEFAILYVYYWRHVFHYISESSS